MKRTNWRVYSHAASLTCRAAIREVAMYRSRRPPLEVIATLAAVSVAVLAAEQVAPPQAPSSQPTFRVDTNAVILDARVVDRDGRFVSDLTQADFRVFEDDVEQTVTSFSLVNIPIPPTADVSPMPIAEPDVVSNARTDTGRLYVIVLDDLEGEVETLVYGEIQRSANTRSLARDFVENHMSELDRAALLTTSGRKDMAVQFTNNRLRIVDAISKFQGGYGQVFFMSLIGGGMVRDNLHLVMETLKGVSDWLADPALAGRRKGVVLISHRLSRTIGANVNLTIAERERVDMTAFLRAAASANASLYAIDPVGVPTAPDGTLAPVFVDDGRAYDLDRIAGLVVASEATGGFAIANTNNFRPGFARIVEENSSYYLLGYTSTDSRRDSRFRRIRVEVARPGFEMRTRSGYVAARQTSNRVASTGNLPSDLADLTRSPVPVSGLVLSVTGTPFRREGSRATVAVVVHARVNASSLSRIGLRSTGSMQIAILAADMDGRTRGERGTLNMNLTPQSRDIVAAQGVRLLSSIDLSPGEYQVSVGASDGLLRGSVRYDVTVPDFSKPLAMSGIALGSTLMAGVPTRGPDDRWRKSMGMVPTTDRVFQSADELRLFTEVYDNEQRRAHQTHITAYIQTAEGRRVFGYTEPLKLVPGQTTYPVMLPISLLAMEPGRYILAVEARSTARPDEPVVRQIPFSVE